MKIFNMFKKFFSKKNHETQQKQESDIDFLGSPYGEDALRLEGDISERLKTVLPVKGAYLSMVRYAEDENVRLALVIESDVSITEVTLPLVEACASITTMDILFLEELSEENCAKIIDKCKKFYQAGNPK